MNARDFFDELERRTKRAPREPDPPHVTVPASLVASAKLAAWISFFALVYFLWLYTLDIAKDRAAALHLTQAGTWAGNLEFWFPYVAGFAAVAVGIPYVAKIAIPVFMSLTWKENLWPKLWALVIAMAVSLVVIAGTFAVQGDALMERDREGVVAEQARSAGVIGLQAQLAAVEADLDEMTRPEAGNRLTAQAARAGVAGWTVAIAEAEKSGAPLMPQRRAAMGSAVAADDLRKQRRDLIAKIAAAPTAASVANRVETKATGWIGSTMDWLEGVRAILLSLVMDIVCLLMPWIAQRLEQARNRQLAGIADSIVAPAGAPWADEAHMVPDLREEPGVKARPMAPTREEFYDAETGERLVKIKPKEYLRRAGGKKKGQPVAVDMGPPNAIPPDDAGVVLESDSRAARSGEPESPPEPEAVSEADAWAALVGPAIDADELTRGEEVYDDPIGPAAPVGAGGTDGVMQAAAR